MHGIRKVGKAKSVPKDLMSPVQVAWQVDVYFALRADLIRLGLGPFACPLNINTGVHAILLALCMCQKVGVFGISYAKKMATKGAHVGNRKHIVSTKHDWGFDTLMMRVFHLSRRAALCTA